MSTRITNVTAGLTTLPFPYRGAIAPGRGVVVSDSPATVLANLGGILQVEGVFRLDLTSEPGSAANDPAGGAQITGYPDGLPDPATVVGATPTNPVLARDPSGILFSCDGTAWVNYEGAED